MYLCISTYNYQFFKLRVHKVVNCFKMCIFALARTTRYKQERPFRSCELLQNVYLCISTYNWKCIPWKRTYVVNCFKMCIFALARTTAVLRLVVRTSCELLQNVYLCISTYNSRSWSTNSRYVVNCFKMCIFALARTTLNPLIPTYWQLWIASKCVSLH